MENNKWHLSKYTIFAKNPNKEEMFCVNLLLGTFFVLSCEEYSLLFKLNELNENDDIFKKFISLNIIVNFDEYSIIETTSRMSCSFNESIDFTICPTMACNFNCSYCFEKHSNSKMTSETENDIIILVEKMIKTTNAKNLYITWFGGEPLLEPAIIESLSKKLMKLSKEKEIKYSAGIITNGYLLTQDIVDMLNKIKVNYYQITLDGIGETHNKTRYLINGSGTFDKIVDNLTNLKIKGNISIRHNIYKENQQDIKKLKNFITNLAKKSGNNLSYYPALAGNNKNAEEKKNQINFLYNCLEIENSEIIKDSKDFYGLKGKYCGAQSLNSISINEKGMLYKCWEDVDKPELSFGDVKNWEPSNFLYTATHPQWLTYYLNTAGALNDNECKECIWLPTCAGGCPNKRLFYKKKCIAYKNNPEKFVLAVANKYLNNKNCNKN